MNNSNSAIPNLSESEWGKLTVVHHSNQIAPFRPIFAGHYQNLIDEGLVEVIKGDDAVAILTLTEAGKVALASKGVQV